jgi:NAD(P)-dependent dehydrogenase (short-subunit alcohol dehydrogenase family)
MHGKIGVEFAPREATLTTLEDSMRKRWKNKTIVITGATAGVGRAAVREFARRGARIGLLAREPDRLRTTKKEVEGLGGTAIDVSVDVADAAAVERAAERVEAELGEIDVWINNAMTAVFSELQDIEPEEYRRVTDVTYHGTVWGTQAALRRMLPRNRGRILCVGSALAWRGIPLQSAHCGAKHAILGMFESLRAELLHKGTDVTLGVVHLPAVNTPQFSWVRSKLPQRAQPVAPIFQPEVAARAIEQAARTTRRSTHVTLATSRVIWGNRLLPAPGDAHLSANGYQSQMTNELEIPGRVDNLFEPVRGEYGAHGRFDDNARSFSLPQWLRRHKTLLLVATGALGVAVAAQRSS